MECAMLCRDKLLDLSSAAVMGILNVTPDSFSDGGELLKSGKLQLDNILQRAEAMLAAGAKILDVGGESTRPGAATLTEQEEIDRVLPVVEALVKNFDCIVSVDTSTARVMTESANLGAHLINDVRALERPGALAALSKTGLPVCLMHMRGQPANMQDAPHYENVVADVYDYLAGRVDAAIAAGVDPARIIIDPGFGFGKTSAHNLLLLQQLSYFDELNLPIMVGLSRKRTIGELLDQPVDKRVHGSIAAAVIAVLHGASIVRVHDVAATVEALKITDAVKNAG